MPSWSVDVPRKFVESAAASASHFLISRFQSWPDPSSPVEPGDVKLEPGAVSSRRTPADGRSVRIQMKYEENENHIE
jgi:hypothetical protein